MLKRREKKLTWLPAIILFFLLGQSAICSSVKPGVKGGISLIGMDWRNVGFSLSYRFLNRHLQLDFHSRLGFHGEVFCRIPVFSFLSVQPEVGFSEKGITAHEYFLSDKLKMSVHSYFLDLPVLLQFHFKLWQAEFGVFFGPYGAFKVGEKVVVSSLDREDIKKTNHFKSFDYGLVWGMFRRFKIGKCQMLIELRQNFGLQNPLDGYSGYEFWRFDGSFIRNDTITLMAGVEF